MFHDVSGHNIPGISTLPANEQERICTMHDTNANRPNDQDRRAGSPLSLTL